MNYLVFAVIRIWRNFIFFYIKFNSYSFDLYVFWIVYCILNAPKYPKLLCTIFFEYLPNENLNSVAKFPVFPSRIIDLSRLFYLILPHWFCEYTAHLFAKDPWLFVSVPESESCESSLWLSELFDELAKLSNECSS